MQMENDAEAVKAGAAGGEEAADHGDILDGEVVQGDGGGGVVQGDGAGEVVEGDNAAEPVADLRKCVQNLPWSWGAEAFKKFLKEQNISFATAKKRKGMNVGFLSFESAEDAERAKEQFETVDPKGKKHKLSDVLPRSWEAVSAESHEKNNRKSNENDDSDGVGADPKEENVEPKDVCDVVTPLAAEPYEEQLRLKRENIASVLKKFARHTRKCCVPGLPVPGWLTATKERGGLACEFEGVIASPLVEGYRNKCEFSVGFSLDGKAVVGFQLGMFRKGITAVASPINCRNVSDIGKFYAAALEEVICASEFPAWDKQKNTGFWRMLSVREGRNVKTFQDEVPHVAEVMVIVQVSPVGISDELKMDEYKRMARALSTAASSASPAVPLTALVIQEHVGVSNAAPADAPLIPLAIPGKADELPVQHIHDYIGDLQFRISPTAFFQVNSLAAEKLYALAGEWAGLGSNTLLFDVCCGTGTIGLTLARKVGMVVGIELNAEAVADAWTNAKLNNISNCRFVSGKAEDVINGLLNEYEVLPQNLSEDSKPRDESAEAQDANKKQFSNIVVIVDPPRSGLHPSVVKALRIHSRLKRLVYISCNPDTLVANSIELCAPSSLEKQKKGGGVNWKGMGNLGHARQRVKSMPPSEPFKPVKAVAVDLFPHTHHCEMVMLLER